MFWTYTVEKGYEATLKVGDTVDIANEEVHYKSAKDCKDLETKF